MNEIWQWMDFGTSFQDSCSGWWFPLKTTPSVALQRSELDLLLSQWSAMCVEGILLGRSTPGDVRVDHDQRGPLLFSPDIWGTAVNCCEVLQPFQVLWSAYLPFQHCTPHQPGMTWIHEDTLENYCTSATQLCSTVQTDLHHRLFCLCISIPMACAHAPISINLSSDPQIQGPQAM